MRNLAVVFAFLLVAGIAFADMVPSQFTVSPSTLKPGVSGSLSFTLTNTGTYSVSGVNLYPSGYRMQFVSDTINVGSIGPGASTVVTVPFKVDSAAAAGVYNVQLSAYWVDPVSGSAYKTFSVPVTVASAITFQISSVSYNTTQIHPGDSFTADIEITNGGGAARNARLSSASTSFTLAGSSQITMGDLPTNMSTRISIPLSADSNLEPGLYPIPLTVTYEDSLGATQTASLSIGPVAIYKSTVFFNVVAKAAVAQVLPGQRVTVNVNLTNVGTEQAKSVRVSITSNSTYFVPLDSSDKFIDGIGTGESEGVSFEMGVNTAAAPGFYPLLVTITYSDPRGEEQPQVRQVTGIEVAGVSDLTAYATASPAPVTAGKKYTLSVQVSNIGTTQLKSVRATTSGDFFDMLTSPDSYVGTLNVDDYSTITYPVYVRDGVAPGRHVFTVDVTFRDQNNVERSVSKTAYIDVVSADTAAKAQGTVGGTDGWFLTVVGIVVLACLYLVYTRFIRKRRP